ncbi:MAG: hypothetical protein MUC49_20460 [Raineya sp.]|jgi:hypothetical protein|nr:hypothetical protein [Raineya sp.]
MAELDYKEPSKEFAFAYNHEEQDKKWASRLQDNAFVNNTTTEQTQQNKFLKPNDDEFEKKLEDFKQNYLPKPYGGLEWSEFQKKMKVDDATKTTAAQKEFNKQFQGVQLSYVLIKYPYISSLINKDYFEQYDKEVTDNHTITKPLQTGRFNVVTAREALDAYEHLDKLHPAYVTVWFHNYPIEGNLLLSNLSVQAQHLPKISLVRGFQEKQAEPGKEKKIDKATGKEKEVINYNLKHTEKNNVTTLVNTIIKELSLNKKDNNMLSLLADIVMEAGLEDTIKKELDKEEFAKVAGKDNFLNFLNKNEAEYNPPKPDEKIDESNLGKESNFLKGKKLSENYDKPFKVLKTAGIATGAGVVGGLVVTSFGALFGLMSLAPFGLILGGVAALAASLFAISRPMARKISLAKLQKKALGMPTLGGSFFGLEISDEMKQEEGKTTPEAFMEWLKSQGLEQDEPEKKHHKKYRKGFKKLNYGDISIDFDDTKNFKIAATALPIAQTSTLFSDMSVRSKAGYFKHLYVQISRAKSELDDSLVDVYVGDVLMENLRFIFPESTYGMGRLKAKNLHIQLRHQDLTNTTNLNSLIQGAIFMLMYRMMTDTGQIKTSADLLHKALGQNIHEGMTLDANAQSIAIENFYGTDFGKIGKIELGGDSPEDNTHISVTTTANPEQAQDQNVPNKKFLAEKKEELEELRNEFQSKKSAKSDKKDLQKLEEKIQALEQEIAKPEKEVLDSELKSQVNVLLETNKLRFEEADMISSMVAEIAKAKLEEFGMKFENLKGLENFRVNGLKLGSSMSPQAITDLFFSSNEIIFDALDADKFAYTLKDETKKDDKGKPLSTPTMSIKGGKTKMEGTKLDFYMKYPDYKVGEKFNEDDLPFDKLQIKNLHIPLTSIEDFHVVDEQSNVELTRLNGLSFIRDIRIGITMDAKGLESFSLQAGKIDQQNKDQKNQTQNNFAFKTKDMDLNGKYILNGISGIDYKLTTKTAEYKDLNGKEQSKRLMNHTFKLGSLSLGKSELSSFNMGTSSDSFFVSSKKGDIVSLEGINMKDFKIEMQEEFMSDKDQQEEHKTQEKENPKAKKQPYQYDPAKTKLVPKSFSLKEFDIAKVKGGNLKVNINSIDEKTKKVTPNFYIDLGKDGFLENVKISDVKYDETIGKSFLAHLTSGKLEMHAFKVPTMLFSRGLGTMHGTETGKVTVTRFHRGENADQRGATFTIQNFKSKFEQPKNNKGDLLEFTSGANLDGEIYDNGRFVLNSQSYFTIPKLNWKSKDVQIFSNHPTGIKGIKVDILPIRDNSPERNITHFQINELLFEETHAKGLFVKKGDIKIELPKDYQTIVPNIWLKGLVNKKTLNFVGKGGLKNGFDWNEIKVSVDKGMHDFLKTNMALQAEKLDLEYGADGSFTLEIQKLESGLNKNNANTNSLKFGGKSFNTPLDNSFVKDPNNPNQASFIDADKIKYKNTPDKETLDKEGKPIMRKTIILENPTLNFLPLRGQIVGTHKSGGMKWHPDIVFNELLLNGKTKGNLIVEEVKIDLGNDYFGPTKDKNSNILLKQARGKEEVWRIRAEGGEFELNNINANIRNIKTLSEMFSDEERSFEVEDFLNFSKDPESVKKNIKDFLNPDVHAKKPEKKKEPFKNQDFAFLDDMTGSSIDVFIYDEKTTLYVSHFDKNDTSFKNKDRNDKMDGAYVNVTDFLKKFTDTFLKNIKFKHIKSLVDTGLDDLKTFNAILNRLFDFNVNTFWDESGHLIEHALEKSLQNELLITNNNGQIYLRLSSLAALFSGNVNLGMEMEILKDFLIKKYIDKAITRVATLTIDPFSTFVDDPKKDHLEEKMQEKERKDFDKFHSESKEKLKNNTNSSVPQENQDTQQSSDLVPTIEYLFREFQKNLSKANNTSFPENLSIYTTKVIPNYFNFMLELFIYTVFFEFTLMNPRMSMYFSHKKNKGANSSIMGNNGMIDIKETFAQLNIGQKIDTKDKSFIYGNNKHFPFYDFIHHPTITLSDVAINNLRVPVKSDQVIPNTYGMQTYSVIDQLIDIKSLNLDSLELSYLQGWGYNDIRNGRVGDILQKSKIQAWGSGAKIRGFEMILRKKTEEDPKK